MESNPSKIWRWVSLNDIVLSKKDIVSGPFGSNIGKRFFVDKGVPVIRGNNLSMGQERFIDKNFVYVTEKKSLEFKNCEAQSGDLIFTAAGSIGQVGLIPKKSKFKKYIISNKQLRVRPNSSIANYKYLYYWFSSKKIRDKIINLNSGSSVPLITLGKLRLISIYLPNIDLQNKIASFFEVIDDLIENNLKCIDVLKELASKVYQSWFINFNFPGYKETNFKKLQNIKIPNEWSLKSLNDLMVIKSGFAFKSNYYKKNGKFGLVTIKNVQNNYFDNKIKDYIDDIPESMPGYCYIKKNDILLSLTGNVGRICLAIRGAHLLNQRVAKIIPKENLNVAFIYFTFLQNKLQEKLKLISTGTAQQNLSPIKLGKLKILFPNEDILCKFSKICNPILVQMNILKHQTIKLNELKNLLLPVILSGKINMKDLKDIIYGAI